MASIRFFVHLLCFIQLSLYTSASQVRQQPPPLHGPPPILPSQKCGPKNGYTVDWFLRNTLPQHRQEIQGKAVFYTSGAADHIKRLTCNSKDHVSLWQIWHPMLYDNSNSPDNPLSCIHNDTAIRTTFFEHMSEAYAKLARQVATVMHSSQSYTNPPMKGIFGRIEVPALRDATDITKMFKVDERLTQNTTWSIPDKSATVIANAKIFMEELRRILDLSSLPHSELRRRSGDSGDVNVDDVYGDACTFWPPDHDDFLKNLW